MPFGAEPSPDIFQECTERAWRNIREEYCIFYSDDILVASEAWGDHLKDSEHVFKNFRGMD